MDAKSVCISVGFWLVIGIMAAMLSDSSSEASGFITMSFIVIIIFSHLSPNEKNRDVISFSLEGETNKKRLTRDLILELIAIASLAAFLSIPSVVKYSLLIE